MSNNVCLSFGFADSNLPDEKMTLFLIFENGNVDSGYLHGGDWIDEYGQPFEEPPVAWVEYFNPTDQSDVKKSVPL